jgi:AcrR family transcriptional regulator
MNAKTKARPDVKSGLARDAMAVFRRNGFVAAGVDSIAEEACISKRTLYKYYRSKDELIAAVLDLEFEELTRELEAATHSAAADPVALVSDVFTSFARFAGRGIFAGELCRRAADEYRGRNPILEAYAGRFFERIQITFVSACSLAGHPSPVRAAERLALLFQGALAVAQISRSPEPFGAALESAIDILRDRGSVVT